MSFDMNNNEMPLEVFPWETGSFDMNNNEFPSGLFPLGTARWDTSHGLLPPVPNYMGDYPQMMNPWKPYSCKLFHKMIIGPILTNFSAQPVSVVTELTASV